MDMQGNSLHSRASKSNAASIWQRVFVESLLAQFSVRQVMAEQGSVVHGKQKQSGKPLATVVYRSVFTSQQASAVHLNAPHRTAMHRIERNPKATRPALHGGLSESFSAQRRATQRQEAHRGAIQSNAARPFNEWLCRGAFLSAHGTATTSSGNNCIANRRNEPKRNAVSPSNRELIESL